MLVPATGIHDRGDLVRAKPQQGQWGSGHDQRTGSWALACSHSVILGESLIIHQRRWHLPPVLQLLGRSKPDDDIQNQKTNKRTPMMSVNVPCRPLRAAQKQVIITPCPSKTQPPAGQPCLPAGLHSPKRRAITDLIGGREISHLLTRV